MYVKVMATRCGSVKLLGTDGWAEARAPHPRLPCSRLGDLRQTSTQPLTDEDRCTNLIFKPSQLLLGSLHQNYISRNNPRARSFARRLMILLQESCVILERPHTFHGFLDSFQDCLRILFNLVAYHASLVQACCHINAHTLLKASDLATLRSPRQCGALCS